MSEPILHVENLTYNLPSGHPLQRGLNFDLVPGQALVISGPNGSGKTTLLRVLQGAWRHFTGTYTWKIPKRAIEYLPQIENRQVHFPITLNEVVGCKFEVSSAYGLLSEAHNGILWNDASGGERRRALLLRALRKGPKALILDEPFNHLDESSQQALQKALDLYLKGSNGKGAGSVILISHQEADFSSRTKLELTLGGRA